MVPLAYSQAQVSFGIGVGPGYVGGPPVCEYGYYDYYPYACAPYGYYGPNYFVNGLFIGVGPWAGYYGGRGYYGRGYYGRGYYGRGYDRGYGNGFAGRGYQGRGYSGRGYEGRGPTTNFRAAPGGGGFRGSSAGGFHGGSSGSRGGGGPHGGRR